MKEREICLLLDLQQFMMLVVQFMILVEDDFEN